MFITKQKRKMGNPETEIIDWSKSDYYVIGIGNSLKEVITDLNKREYSKCEIVWIENFNYVKIPSFKFIIFLVDYIDSDIVKGIEGSYTVGNITIICSIFNIENIISKYDCALKIRETSPYFSDVESFLDILFKPWYIAVNEIDYLHFFANAKKLRLFSYVIRDGSEEAYKKFDESMINAIEKLQDNQYRYVISSIYTKDGVKANSFIGSHYHSIDQKFRDEKKIETIRHYKRDPSIKDERIIVVLLLIGS